MIWLILCSCLPIQFIDFKIGDDSGYIRFDEPEAAQKARAAAAFAEKGGLTVKNFIATLDPVTGSHTSTSLPNLWLNSFCLQN